MSLADIGIFNRNVRFTAKSGHSSAPLRVGLSEGHVYH